MESPLVSVCIPCYNVELFIATTLNSVLAQTYSNLEIIISDDQSKDKTLDIVRTFNDPRITIYTNDQNLGCSGNYDKALSYARGKYAKLLCADDIISPDCIQKQVEAFEANADKNVVMVTAGKAIISEKGTLIFQIKFPGKGFFDGKKAIRKSVLRGTNIFGEPGLPLLRTDVLPLLEPLKVKYCNDFELWCKVLLHGNLFVLPDTLFSFRIVSSSETLQASWKQAQYVRGFIDSLAANPVYSISKPVAFVGKVMATLKSLFRNFVTFYISKK